jgi:hypothetical protein
MPSAKSHTYLSSNHYPDKTTNIPVLLFFLAVSGILYMGWEIRDEKYLTAKAGLGYWLGIIGSVMMLLLLLYPARKKFRCMHNLGTTKRWFQIHWIMGIMGPLFILFHSNFYLGSFNSKVALFSTLLVAVSGLVGRYIYTKVHSDLYQRHDNFKNLRKQVEDNSNRLAPIFNYDPSLRQHLQRYDEIVRMLNRHGFLHNLVYQVFLSVWTRWTHFRISRELRHTLKIMAQNEGWSRADKRRIGREARRIIALHMTLVLEIAEFNFYERLFAMWHMFHFPLYILLVIVAVVHIVVVHMY